jgi:FtsP/CotA-like multicopper oxidase with cupredoxin domain
MTSSPLNLHVHGVHVSPKGNADNVLLHIPAGMSNTYTYTIPRNMPHGAYWYHSHLHGLTAAQTYAGLAGLLAIGRTDGNLPIVTDRRIPIRNMLLQYNVVSGRADGLAQLTNPNWPQYVSTISPPRGDALANGTYRPLLAPVNFTQSRSGSKALTVWYQGPLSIRNDRGLFQFIPSNLQRFTADGDLRGKDVPADPALPDRLRDVQFTVNGQFQPVIRSKAGQTEIWVLANVSDFAYINVQLTETATGRHPPIAIVGQDGNPYPAVHHPVTDGGTRLLIPPASRFALAVTIPAEGELILEMPPRGGGAKTITAPGVLYTSDGTDNPPALLGSLSVLPSAVSYADGFFVFPTQVLARAVPSQGPGVTTPFVEGQTLGAYTSFVELSGAVPDVKREILISGGFLNKLASTADPKAFVYAFDGGAFPNVPLIQPRLNSVEEWTFVNHNNDEHPIHVHVNDFQVTQYYDPTTGLRTGPDMWGMDNANAPAPTMQIDESVIEPGLLSIRTRFDDYIGTFVMHCHRLNHEDNGLMMLINVIPAVSSYAVAEPGAPGKPAQVRLYDGNGDRLLGTVIPFPAHDGSVSAAMGDVDDDGVLDLIVGAGSGHAPEVAAYAGRAQGGRGAFETELTRFQAFAAGARGGVSVAAAQIDGTSADNIIVGSGPGAPSEVRVYGSRLPPSRGVAPDLFSPSAPTGMIVPASRSRRVWWTSRPAAAAS